RDRPVRPEIRVRPVEEPEPERHARGAGDEGDRTKGVVRELEPRSRDPGEREEEAHPGERQEDRLPRAFEAAHDLDRPAPVQAPGSGDAGRRDGMRGIYVDVRPGKRLVHTLNWDADVGYNAPGADALDEVVIAEIEPDGRGSRLSYTHLGIPEGGGAAAEHE